MMRDDVASNAVQQVELLPGVASPAGNARLDWLAQHGRQRIMKLTIPEIYPVREHEDTAITVFYIGGVPMLLE